MRFWDSSAIVPLLVRQPESAAAAGLLDEDPGMVVSWTTPVECASALARLRREGHLEMGAEARVLAALRDMSDEWAEVIPAEPVRRLALRLLRTHPSRAADALQLAAALTWVEQPQGDVFITLDPRLATAATLEGFAVVPAAT